MIIRTALTGFAVLALISCAPSESQQAARELEIVQTSLKKSPGSREADAATRCAAHKKLSDAYLKEGNQEGYDYQKVFIDSYC